jgi:hypothetical protein
VWVEVRYQVTGKKRGKEEQKDLAGICGRKGIKALKKAISYTYVISFTVHSPHVLSSFAHRPYTP